MTKDALKQLIREIVQEEVRIALPQVMTEIFSSKLDQKVPSKPVVSKPIVQPTVKKEYKKYTDNELLNKALNETVGGIPREGDLVSSGMGATSSVMDHVDKAPPAVAQALTKDYSALMKAMDKKRGTVKSSNIVGMM